MKKTILMSFALLGAVVASADSYIYWMAEAPYTFEYASIAVQNASGETQAYLMNYVPGTTTEAGDAVAAIAPDVPAATYTTGAYWAGLGSWGSDAYSFIIELYDDDFNVTGTSYTMSYAQLAPYIKNSVMSHPTMVPFSIPVPEPTSGLLMLIGVGLLGLRRKRV